MFFAVLFLLPSLASADSSLTHNVGNIEMLVSDWGGLTRIEEEGVYPNFGYHGKNYLDPFSEIWVGDLTGHVASAYDSLDETIILGEWQATTPSGHVEYVSDHPNASQLIHAQYAPERYNDFPFSITVDQYTYAWDSTVHPDNDYIIMKLVLTNRSNLELRDFFLAVQTNWDVHYDEERDDLVDWDAERRSGIAYDSDGTDPTHLALTLISGKLASHNIVDSYTWKYMDSDRSDLMGNGEMDNLGTIGSIPGNYFNVISTGPHTIPPGESVSAIYAFVAGQSLHELQENIDAARKKVVTPGNLVAEPSKEAIYLTWSQGISPDAASYRIYRSNTSGSGYSEIAVVSAGNTAYNDTHTELGITYYYVVTAISPNGEESAYSNEVESSPGVAPPPPQNLAVSRDTARRVSTCPVLHWDSPTDEEITEYVILRNFTGSSPWTAIATVDTSVQSFVDRNVYGGNTYYYTIAAINTYNWTSEYSNVVSMTIDLPKSLGAAADLNAVKVAPNPCRASAGAKLKFIHLTARADIHVYTPAGKLVKTLHHTNESGEEEWDLRNDEGAILASGIYVYYVESFKPEEAGKLTASGKFALIR